MKYKNRIKFLKCISITITLIILASCIPVSVFATENDTSVSEMSLQSEQSVSIVAESHLPETIDLQTAREQGHITRLYSEETDMNTVKFKNMDGTKTVYMFSEDIKYVDESGNVKDKSNKLTKVLGGYTNESNDISTLYPDVLSNGITTTYSNYSINVLFGSVNSSQLDTQLNLSVSANRITSTNRLTPDGIRYDGIYGANTYVTYTQNFNGYKENIILGEDIGKTQFPFLVRTNGLKIVNNVQTLSFIDPITQEIIGGFGTLIMWDSNNNQVQGQYEVVTIKENEVYGVIIVADELFEIPNLTYPVTIDPPLYIDNPASNEIIDTTLFTNYSSSLGGLQSILVGNDSTRGTARALVNFPELLSSSGLINAYNYHVINSAKYHFTCMGNTGNAITINAHAFNSAWNENSTYNSSLWSAFGTQIGSVTIPASSSVAVYSISIVDLINGWLSGASAQNGIMLKAANESQSAVAIGSVEAGYNGNPGIASYRPYVSFGYLEVNNNIFYLRNVGSNQYLTVTGGKDITNTLMIQGARSTTYREQEFRIVDTGTSGNEFIMRPLCSKSGRGRVLGKNGSNQAILTVETNAKAVKFSIIHAGNGYYKFVTNAGLALTASSASGGTTTFSSNNNSNNYQKWGFGVSNHNAIEDYYASLSISYPLNINKDSDRTISSGFGIRGLGHHSGIDIISAEGDPVYSVCSGTVIKVGNEPYGSNSAPRGKYIYVQATSLTAYGTTEKLTFAYLHLNSVNVSEGDVVNSETILGTVGYTGMVDEYDAHLHFEVMIKQGVSSGALANAVDALVFYPNINFIFPHNNNEINY